VEVLEAGKKCVGDVDRLAELQEALRAITDSGAWSRPFVFLRHADLGISRATLDTYTPNTPMDLPGLVYAAVGLVLAVLAYKGIKLLCRSMGRALTRKRNMQVVSEDGEPLADDGEE